jgi:arginyl-tRNA synthetase
MTFNPKESIDFNGNTGPFIQYTYARIQSLLRKVKEAGVNETYGVVAPQEKEITLIQRLADFPSVVTEAGKNYSPALIANYVYDLVKEYNQFYHDCPIMKEDDSNVRAFRIALSRTVGNVIARATSLLGMEVPERM